MKLRATLAIVLLCLASTTWSEETFEEAGGTGRGPRIVVPKAESGCKQETNWPVCADDDWGPKCPSGCRVQGLSDKTDKEFDNRVDAIKKKLKDSESNYKSIEIHIQETYKKISDNLVAAQHSDGSYNQVSDNLRQKIDILRIKVSRQVERIKLLQSNIRYQVVEMKRLEVDIDIKLRACKGSCAKGLDVNVDVKSYENIQKLLLQAESTDLSPSMNPSPILKMRPIKESPVDSKYKSLDLEKEKYPMFSEIEQYSFVLEGKSKEVSKCPNGCRVQGLITKIEKEIFSRVDSAKQSWVTSNYHNIKMLSELKQLHEVADRKMLTKKEVLKNFAQLGNELRRRLTYIKIKVNEQVTKLKHLHSEIEDQLATMKLMEVDIEIRIRTCQGSCQNVQVFMTNLENYGSWKKELDLMRNYQIDHSKTMRNIGCINLHIQKSALKSFKELWPLMEMKQLEMFEGVDQYRLELEDA